MRECGSILKLAAVTDAVDICHKNDEIKRKGKSCLKGIFELLGRLFHVEQAKAFYVSDESRKIL
jgi:hypothetical protein